MPKTVVIILYISTFVNVPTPEPPRVISSREGVERCVKLCYSTQSMITAENKGKAFSLTQTHKTDVGSPQAQASVLTTRIKEVTEHLKANKHDHMGRRGLIQMVARRKKLLKYLEASDFEAYKATVAKLGLRK